MRSSALVITFWSCICHGRRVQSSVKHGEEDIAANDLAELLFAATPAATVRNSYRLTTPLQNPSIAHSQVRMSEEAKPLTVGNNLNLKGKVAFLCGASSEKGFGWAIAKELADAGATVLFGTWPMGLKIFERNYKKKSMEDERRLSDGSLMEVAKVYPLDAVYDHPDQVPEDVKNNKRYKDLAGFTIQEVVDQVEKDYGQIDILVHALANGPEVTKPLLETSREGYLEASSASAYSLVSMVSRFGKIMKPGGSVVSISYIASRFVIPGYGGGMSSAKAQLESDTRTLAYEAGRKWGVRVNTICAGCMASRAATAIGGDGDKPFIMKAIDYQEANSPLTGKFVAEHVGKAALFLLSPMAGAVTGVTLPVDMGLHAMGLSLDSPAFA